MPVLQRWHARIKWRLSQSLIREAGARQTPFWCKVEGASDPNYFYHVDQVPINLTGEGTPYASVGTRRCGPRVGRRAQGRSTKIITMIKWILRFATLQLCVRMCAPVEGAKFRGQGRPSIIFKGKGRGEVRS